MLLFAAGLILYSRLAADRFAHQDLNRSSGIPSNGIDVRSQFFLYFIELDYWPQKYMLVCTVVNVKSTCSNSRLGNLADGAEHRHLDCDAAVGPNHAADGEPNPGEIIDITPVKRKVSGDQDH